MTYRLLDQFIHMAADRAMKENMLSNDPAIGNRSPSDVMGAIIALEIDHIYLIDIFMKTTVAEGTVEERSVLAVASGEAYSYMADFDYPARAMAMIWRKHGDRSNFRITEANGEKIAILLMPYLETLNLNEYSQHGNDWRDETWAYELRTQGRKELRPMIDWFNG